MTAKQLHQKLSQYSPPELVDKKKDLLTANKKAAADILLSIKLDLSSKVQTVQIK